VFACCDVALFRTGVPGTKHRRQHHGQTWQQHRCAGDHVVISTTRVDLVCDRQHGCPRDALLSGPRRPASARSSRVRARRYRIQADLVVGGGAAWSRDAWCAVSPAEDYHFKPLNEHVKVYQRTFRIVQDLVIDASAQAQAALKGASSMTIKGVLSYQACDDKLCFTPQSVPLTWTVTLRQLDRERAKP